jgi:hypothetical protein
MQKILEFSRPNRSGAKTHTGRYAKLAGFAAVAALVLMATTYWSPRDSSFAHATAPRMEPHAHAAAVASLYFPVPLLGAAAKIAPEEHIEAF